jgi:hypothetical protein
VDKWPESHPFNTSQEKSKGIFVKKHFAVCKSFSEMSGSNVHDHTSGKEQDGFLEVNAVQRTEWDNGGDASLQEDETFVTR